MQNKNPKCVFLEYHNFYGGKNLTKCREPLKRNFPVRTRNSSCAHTKSFGYARETFWSARFTVSGVCIARFPPVTKNRSNFFVLKAEFLRFFMCK